jgi:bifunctional pyridoxal-dependent enzyme with beta-cystathionase and maltose regulon repressor activities
VDLSPYLPAGFEGWAAERELAKRLMDNGVFIGAGEEFKSEVPGWFRIVFSMPWDWVEEGLNRYVGYFCFEEGIC